MKTIRPDNQKPTLNALALLPLIFFVLAVLISCSASKKTARTPVPPDEPFVVVEEMPVFPGGDSTLLAYLAQNTHYPEKAKLNKTEGKVIVRFCVNEKGGVDRISVLKGVNAELDAEANRVVGTLPPFKPGRQGGKDVAVWYMVPIDFKLK
jgi:TonB family protein